MIDIRCECTHMHKPEKYIILDQDMTKIILGFSFIRIAELTKK